MLICSSPKRSEKLDAFPTALNQKRRREGILGAEGGKGFATEDALVKCPVVGCVENNVKQTIEAVRRYDGFGKDEVCNHSEGLSSKGLEIAAATKRPTEIEYDAGGPLWVDHLSMRVLKAN